jgi:hypothetical protein
MMTGLTWLGCAIVAQVGRGHVLASVLVDAHILMCDLTESRTISNHETLLAFIFPMGDRFVGHLVCGGHAPA